MWTPPDIWGAEAVRKHPIRALAVATAGTALFVTIAVVMSVLGAPAALGWWVVAGIFIFINSMMFFTFAMVKRQRRQSVKRT